VVKKRVVRKGRRNKIRILAIGDPHGDLEKIKKIPVENVDLILIPGDLSKADIARKINFGRINGKESSDALKRKAFMEIYKSTFAVLRYLGKKAPVYYIWGDFDYSDKAVKKGIKDFGSSLPFFSKEFKKIDNVRAIRDKKVRFRGLSIGGLERFEDVNWVRDFRPDEFDKRMKVARKETKRAKKILGKFGKVDILLCHQPPFEVLDKVSNPVAPKRWNGKNAGSELILDYVKKKKPKYVFCGHIHEGKGMKKVGKTVVFNLGCCGWKVVEIE
jgi:Icc-related predicted phosphoesterase|tara:strand:+ start:6751 stop:7569 length:819 start_codon:yes stop_codon:yes gene_type:complete